MIEEREFPTLSWLHGRLKLDTENFNLYSLIGNIQEGRHSLYYDRWEIESRPIWQPKGELRVVQTAIAKVLLRQFPRHPFCFGFSGGSCKQAAESHVGYRSMLAFDLRHAFSQISHQQVWKALYGQEDPHLSFYSARFVADLCTVGEIQRTEHPYKSDGGFLPQGAATSPRLFDLCLSSFDDKMVLWANRLGLVYTRYADNLFFSSSKEEFPDRVRMILLSEAGKRFRIHKVRLVENGRLCRMLGLNLDRTMVCNTRDFKRAFRGALHHLEYVLANHLDHQKAWEVASGYVGFAIPCSLPRSLWQKFEELKNQIHDLSWGW